MKRIIDKAMKVSNQNARLLAAVYFAILSVIGTIITDTVLHVMEIPDIIAVYKAIFLSAIMGSIFGALYAHKIMHCPQPYKLKSFAWGVLMVITALPFYNAALVYFLIQDKLQLFIAISSEQLIQLYFKSLAYLFIYAGVWLALFAGLASLYLRSRLVYDVLHSQNIDKKFFRKRKNIGL